MTKVVNWGHWAVATFLAVQGLGLLRWVAADALRAWRDPHKPMAVFVPPTVGLCGLLLVSAWGILKWRRWAHTSTLALSVVELATFAVAMTMLGVWAVPPASIASWLGLNLAACVWLALPAVRTRYRQRQQLA
jgi:hypothetical protein